MFSTIHEAELFFNHRRNIGIKPGLERVQELLDRVGNPEKDLKSIHVAGTNGKGSTIHFLNAALRNNGYKTGIFTSPSFTGLTGHIILNDQSIEEEVFIEILNSIYPAVLEMDEIDMAPTEFEILTVIAFIFFSKNGEITLVEAGMGGRFDTTNVVHPLISIITNISIDHTAYLGETVEEIASHKAGIIKPGIPVVLGDITGSPLQVIKKEAFQKEADYYILDKDFHFKKRKEVQKMYWCNSHRRFSVDLSMKGDHQFRNVSLAIKALELLDETGYTINWEQAVQGIAETSIPGRYELLLEEPVIIADAAHNLAGIRSLVETVNQHYPNKEKQVIVAIFKDKNVKEMLEIVSENFTRVTLTAFDHPRAATIEELQTAGEQNQYETTEDWKQWLEQMMKQKEKLVFITGSMHFITLVRNYILNSRQFL